MTQPILAQAGLPEERDWEKAVEIGRWIFSQCSPRSARMGAYAAQGPYQYIALLIDKR